MRNAVNNLQRWLFIILLYASSFTGFLFSGGKTMMYVAFDGLIIFLGITSLGYLRGRLSMIVLFILACIVVNLSYSSNSFMYSMNGVREILILVAISLFFHKVFADDNEDIAEEYIEIFRKFAVFFLVAQIPVAYLQYHQHGPSDWVGGTFGNKGSGVLTLSIICLIFFASDYVRNNTQRVLLYCCMLPLLLNETKVSFIFMPMLIMFLHFKPRLKNIAGAIIGAALFLFVYTNYYGNTGGMEFEGDSVAGMFSGDFLNEYLMGDIYSSDDIPRFTKIILGWNLCAENIRTLLFGMEYGIFKGGTVVESSQFAQSIQFLISGTRPYVFFLLMQGGLLLIAGLFWLLFHVNEYFRRNNKFKMFLMLVFLIMLFYNDALRNQGFVVIFFFCMFYANSNQYKRILEQA
ncbi:MAG: hypothetical protein JNK79_13535 [Chitinophagaceae bacterium]|nr:hypothetical protein [Chitinophagaceae bacterium]